MLSSSSQAAAGAAFAQQSLELEARHVLPSELYGIAHANDIRVAQADEQAHDGRAPRSTRSD